jgi:hypothetical protein
VRFTHCGAAAALLCATSALPSEEPTLAPGTRVRITVPSTGAEPLVGRLVRHDVDALWVIRGRSDSLRGGGLGVSLGLAWGGAR